MLVGLILLVPADVGLRIWYETLGMRGRRSHISSSRHTVLSTDYGVLLAYLRSS